VNDTGELPAVGFPVAVRMTTGAFAVTTVTASTPPADTILSAVASISPVISADTFVPDPLVYRASRVTFVAYAALL